MESSTNSINVYGHWEISLVGEFDPKEFFGFIYEIEEIDSSRLYIGKKQFRSKNKKEMKWRDYTSSSEEVCRLIESRGKDAFKFRILSLASGKSQLGYDEEHLQHEKNVLLEKLPNGGKKYFNKTIGHRHFNGVEKQSEETRRRMSLAQKGHSVSEETRLKLRAKNQFRGISKQIGPGMKGKKQTPEHIENRVKLIRNKPNNKLRGRPISKEKRGKIRESMLGIRHTKERRNNQSEAAKKHPKGSCLFCKKEMDVCNLLRWHGEKCKSFK